MSNLNWSGWNPILKDLWNETLKEQETEDGMIDLGEKATNETACTYLDEMENKLCNILFSLKFFRLDDVNIDAKLIENVKKYENIKIPRNREGMNHVKNFLAVCKRHLTFEKKEEEDDDVILDDKSYILQDVCPISKSEFINPVTQKMSKDKTACSHTYEHDCIQEWLKGENTADCPLSGCNKKVSRNRLLPDYEYIQYKIYTKLNNMVEESKKMLNLFDENNTVNNLDASHSSPFKEAKSVTLDLTVNELDKQEETPMRKLLIKKEKNWG